MEGIAQALHARQDQKGGSPKRHVDVLIQWGMPGGAVGLMSALPSSSVCLSHSMSWEASREGHRTGGPGLYLEGDHHWGKSDDYIKQHLVIFGLGMKLVNVAVYFN